MLQRLTVYLSPSEQQALEKLASSELRSVREQIRIILRKEFEHCGLLQAESPTPQQKVDHSTLDVAKV